MARGKATSSEDKAKIIEAKINTDASSRDIEQELWIPHETISKVLREDFAQVCTKSEKVASLVDRNDSLISLADSYLIELIQNKDEKVTAGHLVSLRESAFKQNQLLTWWATERFELPELNELQKQLMAERYIKNVV